MRAEGAALAGIGSAVPRAITANRFWEGFYRPFYGRGEPRAEKRARVVFRSAGVERRHCAVDPTEEDLSGWTTAERMRRFASEAPTLGARAVDRALVNAGLTAADVDELVVASCTGYGAPGLDVRVAQETGMRADVGRIHVGHMGCYAAVPALKAAADGVAARGKTSVALCLELTSLHVQPYAGDLAEDRDQMVSHALFADAASAVALVPKGEEDGVSRPRVTRFESLTDHDSAALMSWDVTDLGFRMGLSPEVPKALGRHVGTLVERLLAPEGLSAEDVTAWAVHPGGPEILEVVQQRLGISDERMATSWEVLRSYGNCSSATVFLILERILSESVFEPGESAVALAFGPGLSAHAALLKG